MSSTFICICMPYKNSKKEAIMLLTNLAGENVFRSIKRKRNELLTYVMIVVVFIITLFGCINIFNSCKIINNQANTNFIYLTKNIKQSENNYFHAAEEETKHCKKVIEFTIDTKKLNKIAPTVYKYNKNQIPYIENYLESIISPLFLYSTEHLENLVSIYFIFDPEFLSHRELIGLWYTDPQLKSDFKLTDNGPITDMYPENRHGLEWYYVPKKLKKGAWSTPYIDNDIKITMITYSTPVYSDKKFLGIMGIDISMDEIKNFICKFNIYKTGKAYLIGKNNKIIFAKDYKPLISTSVIDKNLYSFLNKICAGNGVRLDDEEIKLIESTSSKKLFAVTKLYNDFILVLEAPVDELYAETIRLIGFTFSLLVLAVLIVSLITIEANINLKRINNDLMHNEKLISLGTIVAEIAHEINNPIGFLSCNIDTLKKFIAKIKTLIIAYETTLNNLFTKKSTVENEVEQINNLKAELKADYVINSLDELIDESKEGIKRVSEIVINLKSYAEDDRHDVKSSENLEKIIEESLAFLNGKIKSGIEVTKVFEDIPPLFCNKNQLEQVLINLIDNASYSVIKKGHPDKKISIAIYKKGKNACIEIEDNGMGIEKNKINRIFDPFFTTKGHKEGTGLGLSIAYEIITKKHKGEISVESKKGNGTKFTIKIPY